MADVKKWLAISQLKVVRRKRAQSVRAFGVWCEKDGLEDFGIRAA